MVMSRTVKIGDTIYVSGQVSHDDDGNIVGRGDMEAQMRQACSNIKNCWHITEQPWKILLMRYSLLLIWMQLLLRQVNADKKSFLVLRSLQAL